MRDTGQATAAGRGIEEASFALIDAEVGPHRFSSAEWQVARRVIHATADFDFARSLVFHRRAIEAGIEALKGGAAIVCDVQMIAAGLSRERLSAFGCSVACLISDHDVLDAARRAGTTRGTEAMNKAHRLGLLEGAIVAVGNAPTALQALEHLVVEQGASPALVIGVPVGFVGAADAKEAALALPVPSVVARGRKGGSPVAVAVVHALLALAAERPI